MKIAQMIRNLLSSKHVHAEVEGAPPPLKEFEKQFIRKTQDDLHRALQVLEVEVEVASRK